MHLTLVMTQLDNRTEWTKFFRKRPEPILGALAHNYMVNPGLMHQNDMLESKIF